jgi:hypothetical protein
VLCSVYIWCPVLKECCSSTWTQVASNSFCSSVLDFWLARMEYLSCEVHCLPFCFLHEIKYRGGIFGWFLGLYLTRHPVTTHKRKTKVLLLSIIFAWRRVVTGSSTSCLLQFFNLCNAHSYRKNYWIPYQDKQQSWQIRAMNHPCRRLEGHITHVSQK